MMYLWAGCEKICEKKLTFFASFNSMKNGIRGPDPGSGSAPKCHGSPTLSHIKKNDGKVKKYVLVGQRWMKIDGGLNDRGPLAGVRFTVTKYIRSIELEYHRVHSICPLIGKLF
jgi:hypothetical protein